MSFQQRLQEIREGFQPSFWVANVTELFERLAYYGAFAALANYLHETLGFPSEQTGTLTGLFGGMVWFLAVFGGALADRLGFRRALSLAYLILTGAYFLLGSIGSPWLAPVRNAVPLLWLVTFVLILPALGISLVKPSVVGTTARASQRCPLDRLFDLLHHREYWWRGRTLRRLAGTQAPERRKCVPRGGAVRLRHVYSSAAVFP